MQEKVKEILIRAKKQVFSGNLGNNLTALKGDGIDFAEIRDYNFGDDVRKINWKATAKSGKIKVNEFNEERELNIVVVFLVDGGIKFGTKALKQDIMSEVLALINYSAIKNSDRVSTLFFSSEPLKFIKPSKNLGVVQEAVEFGVGVDAIGKSVDFNALNWYLNGAIKQKSIVILIGDFLQDVDISLIASKHQVYAVMVRDSFEEYPNIEGEFDFINPINLEVQNLFLNRKSAKSLQEEIKKHDNKLMEHFLEHRVDFGKIYTDEDVYLRLMQIFK